MNQYQYHETEKFRRNTESYTGMINNFISGIGRTISQPFKEMIQEGQEMISARMIGWGIIFIGMIFFLNGVAIFINDLFGVTKAVGYVVTGLILLLIGKLKKNR